MPMATSKTLVADTLGWVADSRASLSEQAGEEAAFRRQPYQDHRKVATMM